MRGTAGPEVPLIKKRKKERFQVEITRADESGIEMAFGICEVALVIDPKHSIVYF